RLKSLPRAGRLTARSAAGLMSVADTFRNRDFEPLGDLGIGLDGPAHSVLLFSSAPVGKLGGTTLGVTGETSTSFPLLRLLLEDRYGVNPAAYVRRASGPLPSDAGMLLIGDAALQRAARGGLQPGRQDYSGSVLELEQAEPFDEPFRYVLDLAAAWHQWQGLPFVFARWMVRHSVGRQARLLLLASLRETLEVNLRRLDALAAEQAPRAGLSAQGAFAYLMGFTYRFGAAGEQGINTFRSLLESTPWWEATLPAVLETEGA
ncbi:MAG: MqnA/MqnD/SBP family protein, partial [Acidobacteriota bacterium]